MILKETSFTKNVTTNGASTPDFTQDIGQNKAYYMDYQGFAEICVAMLYYQVYDYENITAPLGKGGKRQSLDNMDNYSLELASIFDNIYINGIHLNNESFIMFVIKEERETHHGRRQLKFSRDARYNDNTINESCIQAITKALGCTENGSWIVTEMNIGCEPDSRPRLEFSAIVVDEEKPRDFKSIQERSQFIKSIKPSYFESIGLNAYHEDQTKPLQQIFYGAPGTGKSHEVNKLTAEAEKDDRVFRTTFHPDSDYSTFVGAYKPTMKENIITKNGVETKEEQIVYRFVPQAFTKAYTAAWNTNEEVFLIIEEINRGNCAQIFGDLFQLLDRKNGASQYPVDADTDLADYIAKEIKDSPRTDISANVREGKKLVLPSNLYIWATMNTSDQSLFPIDSAFKRRWDWKYMKIKDHRDQDYKVKIGEDVYDWYDFIDKINQIIASMTSSADKQLGYFFCKADDAGIISADTFVAKVIFYLWNDVFKDYGFEDTSLFTFTEMVNGKEETRELTFPDFYDKEGEKVNEVRLKDFIDRVKNWTKKNEDNN